MFILKEIDGRPVKHLRTITEKRADRLDCKVWEEGRRVAIIADYQFLDNSEKIRYIYETLKPERWNYMDDKIAKLWHWHENLQSVLNDIREAQALIKRENAVEFITRLDELITKADKLADSIAQELKKNKLG